MANVKDNKFKYNTFALSEDGQQKTDAHNQHLANRPGEYQASEYDAISKDYLNQYQNRGPFSYDFNSDALYQQYKDQYIKQGQMAMMDTMGQAAAMTGGYGNSYAQSVGQQAYNQQLGQLNDVMPELYGMAYDRYQQEGQEKLNLYNLYRGLEQENYGKYQDKWDRWHQMESVLSNDANTNWNKEWENYLLGYNTASEASKQSTGITSQYKDIDVGGDVYKTILTEVKNVTSLPELLSLVKRYSSLGYNPDQIDQLTVNKFNELMPKQPQTPSTAGTGNLGGYGGRYLLEKW